MQKPHYLYSFRFDPVEKQVARRPYDFYIIRYVKATDFQMPASNICSKFRTIMASRKFRIVNHPLKRGSN